MKVCTWTDSDQGSFLTCPYCSNKDELGQFDVLGADDGNLFCNHCNREFATVASPLDTPLFDNRPQDAARKEKA